MALLEYLERAVRDGASDLFIVAGGSVSYKLDGLICPMDDKRILPQDAQALIAELYAMAGRTETLYVERGDDDFSFARPGLARFRANAYRQRGSRAAVIRVVSFDIPKYQDLHIPEEVMHVASLSHGMVLLSGTAGSGKSTTQACLIDHINQNRHAHVITLEDPIEFLHRNAKSIISQREIAIDTADYLSGLRACLRQAPDVILLGEMRDFETVRTAMTAAETGHLLIATLHTKGAVSTIDRIIDTFPPTQQGQVRTQLSMILSAVVSQQLLPDVNGGRVPAYEVMHMNAAIRNLIRDSKNYQIENVIAGAGAEGMLGMDQSILKLYQEGRISAQTAIDYSSAPDQMQRRLGK